MENCHIEEPMRFEEEEASFYRQAEADDHDAEDAMRCEDYQDDDEDGDDGEEDDD